MLESLRWKFGSTLDASDVQQLSIGGDEHEVGQDVVHSSHVCTKSQGHFVLMKLPFTHIGPNSICLFYP